MVSDKTFAIERFFYLYKRLRKVSALGALLRRSASGKSRDYTRQKFRKVSPGMRLKSGSNKTQIMVNKCCKKAQQCLRIRFSFLN